MTRASRLRGSKAGTATLPPCRLRYPVLATLPRQWRPFLLSSLNPPTLLSKSRRTPSQNRRRWRPQKKAFRSSQNPCRNPCQNPSLSLSLWGFKLCLSQSQSQNQRPSSLQSSCLPPQSQNRSQKRRRSPFRLITGFLPPQLRFLRPSLLPSRRGRPP